LTLSLPSIRTRRSTCESRNRFLLALSIIVAGTALAGCSVAVPDAQASSASVAPRVEMLSASGQPNPALPFSEAVRYGNTLYLAGQLGIVPGESELVPGGIQAETAQAMANIAAVLKRHGSGMDKILKCTIFLADIAQWGDMNVAYVAALGDHRPARSALGVSGLARGAAVEIECLAGY